MEETRLQHAYTGYNMLSIRAAWVVAQRSSRAESRGSEVSSLSTHLYFNFLLIHFFVSVLFYCKVSVEVYFIIFVTCKPRVHSFLTIL